MRYVLPAAILVAHLAVGPGPASMQTLFDHLKCHTVHDPLRLEATADLPAVQPEFADQGCKVGRAKLFCVPTGKENVAGTRTAGAGDRCSAASGGVRLPARWRPRAPDRHDRGPPPQAARSSRPSHGPTAPAAALSPSGTSQLPLCASPSDKPS